MTRHRQLSLLATALVVVVGSLVIDLGTAQGESARTIGPTPPRLAFIEGEVSFWRPGADDWTPARINMPLAAGDSLYTGDGAHLELAVGRRAFVRTAPATKLDIASLETGYLQLELASGHAALDLKDLPEGQRVEVDTPQGAVTIDRAGYYRIDVDEHTVVTTHRGGPATVIPIGGGSATDVAVEQQTTAGRGSTTRRGAGRRTTMVAGSGSMVGGAGRPVRSWWRRSMRRRSSPSSAPSACP